MSAFDRIAGYKKEKEELIALAEFFKNRKKDGRINSSV